MTACIICGGECPPRRPGHNGGGRPRLICGPDCKRAYNRKAARVAYRRLRALNERGFYAKWQRKEEHHAG